MDHDYDFTTLEDLFYGYMVLYGDENVTYGLIMMVDQTRMQAGCEFFWGEIWRVKVSLSC